MKPDKHSASAAVILIVTACLIALTWVGTIQAIRIQRIETFDRTTATLANQALTFAEQINRQILGFDQTLRILVTAWEANPRTFDLESWRRQTSVLDGLSRDMVLTDENGIIRQSSVAEAINQNASGLDYFRVLSDPAEPGDRLYIGPAAIDGIMRQWHMNVARALHHPDGSFAGVINADYRIAAITDVFKQTIIGSDAFFVLAGLEDGKLRGALSATAVNPDASISETQMFAAVTAAESGVWTGPSANDAVQRIHAFRRVPGRNLAVIVAVSEDSVLRSLNVWGRQAEFTAGVITVLLTSVAILLILALRLVRRRRAEATQARADIAASNAQSEVARAVARAKAEQLDTTLASMSDGVSIVDAHMCLVEWNVRFPEIAGISADILRVGLPMEEIIRTRIKAGHLGPVEDAGAEVERRMAHLRSAPAEVVQRQRPDPRNLRLRRNRLPDGGFVTIYTDITEHELAAEAFRKARTALAAANTEKSQFIAMISHEIRTPLDALQNAVQLLADSVLVPAQRSLVAIARQASDALAELVGDVLDVSQTDARKLAIRPSLFQLRPLLDSCADMLAAHAADARQSIHVAIADDTPAILLADPARVRQVLLNLLSHALQFARPGEIWLTAGPGHDSTESVRLTVTDSGPATASDGRDPSSASHAAAEAGHPEPGHSICHHLVAQMGGQFGCDARRLENGTEVNAVWITLPISALPQETDAAPADFAAEPEVPPTRLPPLAMPRTRVLLSADMSANHILMATLLRRQGHHVDVVADGLAAIEAIRARPYELMLMDIVMPGPDAQAVVETIRALPEPARSTPIIALSSNAAAHNDALAAVAGVNDTMVKPVALTDLLEILRHHVWFKSTSAPDNFGSTNPDKNQLVIPPLLSSRRIHELRASIPAATLVSAVEECLLDMDRRFPALRRSLAARAPGAVTAHAQAMVGIAAAYGMTALENRLRATATAARDGDLASLGPSIAADLDKDFEQTALSLREILRTVTV
jgi:signal transduction histidine kinase/CheY-like chemotaxis protein